MMIGLPLASIHFHGVMPLDPTRNMAFSMALGGLSFLLTIIIGRPIVTYLRIKKVGKQIREEGPETHFKKVGTPTMGGVMVAVSVVIITVVFNLADRLSMLLPTGILIASGTLGAIDDRMSLVGGGGSRHGLAARFKMLWLLLFGSIAALILHLPKPWGLALHHMYVPFWRRIDIGNWYLPIAIIVIVAMANGVNFADGLDTLAAGLAAIAFVAYGVIAYGQGQVGVVTFCFTMVGSLLGFLWFNAHPAQVFMGDTGSLAIGASLATAAFMTGQWLLLPVVGFVFVVELLSVIIQVTYFKATHGKRVFRMTPIHHHFEKLGWSETQVTMRFWIVGMICGLLGVALALL